MDEPFINQNSNFSNSDSELINQNPDGNNQINNGKKRKISYFSIFGIIVVISLVYFLFIKSIIFPNALEGNFVDMVYTPDATGHGKIWFVTDGSFYYTSKKIFGGDFRISTESIFNKIFTYTYDPIEKKVYTKSKTDFSGTPPKTDLINVNGKIWVIGQQRNDASNKNTPPPFIKVFDGANQQEILNTDSFTNKYPQLKSGIVGIKLTKESKTLEITTRDGQSFVFSPNDDRVFENSAEYNKFTLQNIKEPIGIFTLVNDGSSDRKKLYFTTGSKKILGYMSLNSNDENSLRKLPDNIQAKQTIMTPEKVYIKPAVIYADNEIVVILSQTDVTNTAKRMLTCVGTNGKILWELHNDQLFNKIKLNPGESFTNILFIKNDTSGERNGDLFFLKVKGNGTMAIDMKTGAIVWKLEL